MKIKSEKLGINSTPATLFVGVGGIGSDIVTRVAEMCAPGEDANLRFVAMDTNANDLRGVKSSTANIIPIQTSSPQSVLDYLKNDEDARNCWFPNNTTLYSKTVSEGAGQVRAISRLALNATIKTGEIQKLYKAIDSLFLKDDAELKQALRVVVCSSSSGGTGSGIAMTVGMLIREYMRKHYREKALIVRGFLILPGVMDTVIKTETERESQRRNGYAAIKEINAFMVKASGFCSVRKDLERYKDLHIDVPTTAKGTERLDNLPFDFCFLLDRVDQSQESMMTLEQYKAFAARSLYEQNIGPMQGDAFSIEDNIIKEFADGNNLGRNRFGGIGASALRYPYELIADYVAYNRAMERIGSGDTVGEWLKYDKKFEQAKAEFKKKRNTSNSAAPKLADIYVQEVNNGDQRFDMDIKRYLSADGDNADAAVNMKIKSYLASLEGELKRAFENIPEVKEQAIVLNGLRMPKDYANNKDLRGTAVSDLSVIRNYQNLVKKYATNNSRALAQSILYDAPAIVDERVAPYHLESLFKSTDGAMHPNAMRYVLYRLYTVALKKYEAAKKDREKVVTDLLLFSSTTDNADYFDVSARYSKEEEINIDQVCNIENTDPSFIDKITGGFTAFWDKLNELFPAFMAMIDKYKTSSILEATYDSLVNYISQLNKQFESFYGSFEAKVTSLSRKQDEIVEQIRFKKGDFIRYVCATKDQLDMIVTMCPESSEGLLLPESLNSDIFEAIKKNAESDRLAEYDVYGDYEKYDVFDEVVIDYFRESVREECKDIIDLNIIKALALEQKLKAFAKANMLKDDDEERVTPKISPDEWNTYLKDCLNLGQKLAAPGVGCTDFNEPRDVPICSYNKALNDLRDINVKQKIESLGLSARAATTVSKYDLRFFKAVYNITPDKLSRFKSPQECREDEQYSEDAGIYYNAYHEYIKKLGPDSTKSATISLHIDKRWDSLTEMPEISMDAHYDEMVKIHSALVYAVTYGMIRKYQSSRYDVQKRIFALEDTQGEQTALIVSNNTECDEFYEVLDALYRDRASVAKIYEMVEERCKYDVECNRRYTESSFFKDATTFRIGDGHKAPTSLFEIPLAYYNSLPRAKLDDNELAIMIDAIINVLEIEIDRYEQEVDRAPFLANRLVAQFKLLVENFQNDEYNEDEAMRKNTILSENKVINMVFKKLSIKLKSLSISNFSQKIEELRDLIK